MRNFLRICFVVIALFFVCGAVSVSETNAQVNQILKQMQSRYKKLKTLRASILSELYNSQLRDSDTMQGSLILLPLKGRNALVRVDWKKPREELLSIDDKQYIAYNPGLNQAYIGGTEQIKKDTLSTRSPLAFINMSKAQLKANYSIKYLGAEKLRNGKKTWHLELTPKQAQNYKKTDLWIDGNGMPLQVKLTQLNNDTNTVLLSGLKKMSESKKRNLR
jgi:outer membrane lipoprotein-sorting protein